MKRSRITATTAHVTIGVVVGLLLGGAGIATAASTHAPRPTINSRVERIHTYAELDGNTCRVWERGGTIDPVSGFRTKLTPWAVVDEGVAAAGVAPLACSVAH